MSALQVPFKFVLWLIVAVLAAPVALAEEAATRLVVFGDSLSDPGNFYAAFGVSSVAPYLVIPVAPYTIGGHHFSNGKTWVEQLAIELGSPNSARPALVSPGVYMNYAVGGARARANAPEFPYYDLTTQVGLYLATVGGRADGSAVHVVWIGGDDLRDALAAAAVDPTFKTSSGIVAAAIESTVSNIVTLWSAGARTFLVANAPDLSRAPAVRALGPAAIGGALQLSVSYNGALDQALAPLAALPGIRLIRLNDFALLDAFVATPAAFDLENATVPCLKFGVIVDAVCEEPGDYLFWDGIHPTSSGHRLVAHAALDALRAARIGEE